MRSKRMSFVRNSRRKRNMAHTRKRNFRGGAPTINVVDGAQLDAYRSYLTNLTVYYPDGTWKDYTGDVVRKDNRIYTELIELLSSRRNELQHMTYDML